MDKLVDDDAAARETFAPSGVRVTVATALIAIATLQFGIIVTAVFRLMDPGWPTTDVFGAISWVASAVVVVAFVASPGRRSVPFLAVSVVALVAALIGAAAWASLAGGTFLVNETEAPRITTLIAVDLVFAAWLVIARFAGSIGGAPVLGGIALFASVRAVLEAAVILPQVMPRTPVACCAGATAGDPMLLAAAGLLLGGFIVFPLWQFALARWLLRGPSPVASP